MKPFWFLIFAAALCNLSCSAPEVNTAEELNQYIQEADHNLAKRTEINGYTLTVTFKPTDLIVSQELGEAQTSQADLDQLEKKYSNYYYFILSLSKNNREALQPSETGDQYSDLVQTLSFRMNEYASLTTSAQDTIPVGDFMLNRTFGLSASTDLLFVFNKEKASGKDWVQFNLNEFGLGLGNQRFRFKIEDIESVPRLKFNVAQKTEQ
jgi:hypothetical protein